MRQQLKVAKLIHLALLMGVLLSYFMTLRPTKEKLESDLNIIK
jgi:uncharacterized protein YneF (UPF0154 family)